MIARTQKEIRQRAPLWLAGLLIFNAALMTLQARRNLARQNWFTFSLQTVVGLVQRPTAALSSGGADVLHHLRELRQADAENQQLKQQLAAALNEVRDLRATQAENERLKSLLDFKEQGKFQIVPARVIARDPTGWFNVVTINRGRSAGVQNGMPVVTLDGIVGRIVGTSLITAEVMLITDEKAAAGAVIGSLNSTAAGSIRGYDSTGLLEMNRILGLEIVNKGDKVYTTGQDGIYPPGYSIGEVIEVKTASATAQQTIYVKPSANLANLDAVAVLLYHAPERVVPDQTLQNQQNQTGHTGKSRK